MPESVALMLGDIKMTPVLAVSIPLFPLLIFGCRLKWCWPDLLVIAVFTSFFISTLRSVPLDRTLEHMGRLVLVSVVPYLAGRFIAADLARMKRFLSLLVTLLATMAGLSVLESVLRINVHSIFWRVPYDPHHEKRLGLTRAYGWTSHAIMFGLVNAVFISVILVSAKEKLAIFGRWQWFKFFAVSAGCFLSLSTGAWGPAALAVSFVAWDYFAPFKSNKLWPVTFAVLIIGYFVLEYASGRPLLRILMMKMHLTSPDAWYYRWRLFERVYAVMPGNWWLGHGKATPEAFNGFQGSIDNNFLVVLLRYGRIGLILWCAVPIAIIMYAGKAVWARRPSKLVRVARAMCFALIGILLTQFSVALFSTANNLYWMMMGLIIGVTFLCRAEQTRIAMDHQMRKRKHDPRRRQQKPLTQAPYRS
ncbi:MAG: O-antigen ligase family protein [Planctomycetota bacterium]